MSTITQEQADRIAAYLETHELPSGIGSEEGACSIAAINLALTGRLTDTIPDCMSRVIGKWIVQIQDSAPHEMRNSPEWKRLLPLAAGTGRKLETQRLAVAMDWMWTTVLPQVQPLADERGFGAAWKRMTTEKTRGAAYAAAAVNAAADAVAYAADAAVDADADAAAAAAADAVAYAADAYVDAAADAYAAAAVAADAVAYAADAYVDAAADAYAAAAVDAAVDANIDAASKAFWVSINPAACLARMIAVSA